MAADEEKTAGLLYLKLLNKVALTDKPTSDYSMEKSGPVQPGYYIYKWLIRGLSSKHSTPLNINIPETVVNNKANEISKIYYDPLKKSVVVDADISMEDNVDREVLVREMMDCCIRKSVSMESIRRNIKPNAATNMSQQGNFETDTGDPAMNKAVKNIRNEIVAVWKKPTWGPGAVCNYTELLLPSSLQGRILEMSSNGVQLLPVESKGKNKQKGDSHHNGQATPSTAAFSDTGGGLHSDIPAGVVQRYIHGRSRTAGFHRIFWQASGNSENPYNRASSTTTAYRISRNVSYPLFDETSIKPKHSYQDDEVCEVVPIAPKEVEPVKDKTHSDLPPTHEHYFDDYSMSESSDEGHLNREDLDHSPPAEQNHGPDANHHSKARGMSYYQYMDDVKNQNRGVKVKKELYTSKRSAEFVVPGAGIRDGYDVEFSKSERHKYLLEKSNRFPNKVGESTIPDARDVFLENFNPMMTAIEMRNSISKAYEVTKELSKVALCCITNNSLQTPQLVTTMGRKCNPNSTFDNGDYSDVFNTNNQRLVITKVASNSAVQDPIDQIGELVQWLQRIIYRCENVNIRFSSMVVDFIKEGSTGEWYMIQVKGFDIAPESQDYVLIWNYYRLLRIKNNEDVDEDFHDFMDGKRSQNDAKSMKLSSANKLLKNVSANRLGKLDTHQQLLLAAMNTTSKERIAKLMSERGTKCKCCGLYYLNDQLVTVLSANNAHKMDEVNGTHGNTNFGVSNDGKEIATAQLESKQVPAFGYQLSMSMAYKLFQLYRDQIVVSSREYYDATSGLGAESSKNAIPNVQTESQSNSSEHGTRRVLKLTKFARDVLSHFDGEKTSQKGKVKGTSSWMPSMYDSIVCCYYCNQVIGEYNKYVTALLSLNSVLGVPISKSLASSSHNFGSSGPSSEGGILEEENKSQLVNTLDKAKAATNNTDNALSLDVHQYVDEVNSAIKKRRQFLINWFHKKHQQSTGETGPPVGLSVNLADNDQTIALPKEVRLSTNKLVADAIPVIDHISASDIYDMNFLIKHNNDLVQHERKHHHQHKHRLDDITSALAGGEGSNLIFRWRMLFMFHFLTDMADNTQWNMLLDGYRGKHMRALRKRMYFDTKYSKSWREAQNRDMSDLRRSVESQDEQLWGDNIQLYGQFKYVLGQKVTVIEFPMTGSESTACMTERKMWMHDASGAGDEIFNDSSQFNVPSEEPEDATIWIQQCRVHYMFGSAANCKEYFHHNEIPCQFTVYSLLEEFEDNSVALHASNMRNSEDLHHHCSKKSLKTDLNSRIIQYEHVFSLPLNKTLQFIGKSDEIDGATEKIDIFVPLMLPSEAQEITIASGSNQKSNTKQNSSAPIILKFSVALARDSLSDLSAVVSSFGSKKRYNSTDMGMRFKSSHPQEGTNYNGAMLMILQPAMVKEEAFVTKAHRARKDRVAVIQGGLPVNSDSESDCDSDASGSGSTSGLKGNDCDQQFNAYHKIGCHIYWPQPSYIDSILLPTSWIGMMTTNAWGRKNRLYKSTHKSNKLVKSPYSSPSRLKTGKPPTPLGFGSTAVRDIVPTRVSLSASPEKGLAASHKNDHNTVNSLTPNGQKKRNGSEISPSALRYVKNTKNSTNTLLSQLEEAGDETALEKREKLCPGSFNALYAYYMKCMERIFKETKDAELERLKNDKLIKSLIAAHKEEKLEKLENSPAKKTVEKQKTVQPQKHTFAYAMWEAQQEVAEIEGSSDSDSSSLSYSVHSETTEKNIEQASMKTAEVSTRIDSFAYLSSLYHLFRSKLDHCDELIRKSRGKLTVEAQSPSKSLYGANLSSLASRDDGLKVGTGDNCESLMLSTPKSIQNSRSSGQISSPVCVNRSQHGSRSCHHSNTRNELDVSHRNLADLDVSNIACEHSASTVEVAVEMESDENVRVNEEVDELIDEENADPRLRKEAINNILTVFDRILADSSSSPCESETESSDDNDEPALSLPRKITFRKFIAGFKALLSRIHDLNSAELAVLSAHQSQFHLLTPSEQQLAHMRDGMPNVEEDKSAIVRTEKRFYRQEAEEEMIRDHRYQGLPTVGSKRMSSNLDDDGSHKNSISVLSKRLSNEVCVQYNAQLNSDEKHKQQQHCQELDLGTGSSGLSESSSNVKPMDHALTHTKGIARKIYKAIDDDLYDRVQNEMDEGLGMKTAQAQEAANAMAALRNSSGSMSINPTSTRESFGAVDTSNASATGITPSFNPQLTPIPSIPGSNMSPRVHSPRNAAQSSSSILNSIAKAVAAANSMDYDDEISVVPPISPNSLATAGSIRSNLRSFCGGSDSSQAGGIRKVSTCGTTNDSLYTFNGRRRSVRGSVGKSNRPVRQGSIFASNKPTRASIKPQSVSEDRDSDLADITTAGGLSLLSPKRRKQKSTTITSSAVVSIHDVYVICLPSEFRRKRRYNLYLSIFELVFYSLSQPSRPRSSGLSSIDTIDVVDLYKYLVNEQEKLRRFMMLANDSRILIPPVTTLHYDESPGGDGTGGSGSSFLTKFSLVRSLVCCWLLTCSSKLKHLFRMYVNVDDEGSNGKAGCRPQPEYERATKAVINKVGFMTIAEETFQRVTSLSEVEKYTFTKFDPSSILAFVECLRDDRNNFKALHEGEDLLISLADRNLTATQECLFVTMVCDVHGRELFFLHDLCCCQCIMSNSDC